jgi:hypothetical protein
MYGQELQGRPSSIQMSIFCMSGWRTSYVISLLAQNDTTLYSRALLNVAHLQACFNFGEPFFEVVFLHQF